MTLLGRLLLFCAICVFPPAVLATWHIFQERHDAETSVSRMAINIARFYAAQQTQIGEGANEMLHALSLLPEVREHQTESCNRTFRSLGSQFTNFKVIGAAAPDGRIWCSSREIDDADIGQYDFFREAVGTHRFTNGGYVVGRQRGDRTLSLALPVYDKGRLITVLHAALDVDRLADLGETQLPPASALTVLDPKGVILGEEPKSRRVGQALPPRLRAAVLTGRAGVLDTKWIDGRRKVIGYAPAPISGSKPLTVLLEVDWHDALAPADRRWAYTLALTSLIVAIFVALAWRIAARGIREPIAQMGAAVESWRRGDLSARVGRIDGGAELERLGAAFDAMAEAVQDRERRLSNVLESTSDMVMTVDKDLRITFLNQRAIARMGGGDYLGRRIPELFRDAWGAENWAALRRSLVDRVPARVTLAARTGHFEIHIYPSADGGLTLFSRELTEQRRAEAELSHLALHDRLTGLPNRKQLEDYAASALKVGNLAALILLDLDGFKHVNDTLGHPAGDEVLRDVAARLSNGLGGRSMLARLGGDEFVILLTGKMRPGEVETIAADLQKALERQPFLIRGRLFRITASAGVVFVPPEGGVDPEVLLANADLALYRAKASGGGVSKIFNARDREHYEAGRRLEEELDLAVERGEFELRYQAQVRLADGVVLGAEALLRWNHPRRGLLTPADFLSAIEGSRHARKLGGWILDQACRQAGEWCRAGWPLRIGVNLFAEQLKAGDLVDVVEMTLHRAGLPPEALTLELTENIALGQEADMLAALRTLHARGVGVDFDDFGTGFASLTTLRDFPLTRLKIDRSFISRLPESAHDAAIVEAVLALARSLGLAVVAEGIETQEQAEFLASRGCDEGQGYLYGAPKPASEFLKDHLAPVEPGTPATTSARLRAGEGSA